MRQLPCADRAMSNDSKAITFKIAFKITPKITCA